MSTDKPITSDAPVQPASQGPHVSYMVRRETHSSRAITASIVGLIVAVVLVWLIAERILTALGKPNLLASWEQIANSVVKLPAGVPQWALIVGGIIATLLGLWMLGKALGGGALDRHSLASDRVAYIVDDKVTASALSRAVREHAGLPEGQVATSLSKRNANVQVTPTSGRELDTSSIQSVLNTEVEGYQLNPATTGSVKLNSNGEVAK
ncbi:MAG: EI24 domain-containing protein [Winkia sp. UMB750A]|uniref:EI24 domain-containing protein n=1 Tax=Winkia TaxID=2692118 RepID=UPI0014304143|nr:MULTISPECIES: EI24 domain-containing protein [Winkia]MDK7185895.1 EI24 domain-containing protein [Winkia sp. UMB1295B]MDK8224577.1 EI24 domain-containing protein [Winkia sp. UMB750B]MDK8256254.1 EI24 domain-containing protein [Winkia sp. UMB750A]NJJ15506.1 EI24 domain-containing protein [Winkia neuii]